MLKAVIVALAAALAAAGSNDEGVAFLAENAKKEGVISLPSGLQYKVLRSGDGDAHPKAGTSCSCHYAGTLIDGTTFDSSYDRGSPTSFAPNQVIKGWTEAMQLMVEGDKWEMYIPSDLGYGDRGSPPKIPGGSVLVFTMEIIKINGETVPAVKCDVATKDKCTDREAAYIDKMRSKGGFAKELKRLSGMDVKNLAPELASWLNKRKSILGKMIQAGPEL